MKIYNTPKAPYQVKLQISKRGQETQHISFIETTMEDVELLLKSMVQGSSISPFREGYATCVNIREWLPAPESKNGRQKFISFYGMEPKELLELLNLNIAHDKTQ